MRYPYQHVLSLLAARYTQWREQRRAVAKAMRIVLGIANSTFRCTPAFVSAAFALAFGVGMLFTSGAQGATTVFGPKINNGTPGTPATGSALEGATVRPPVSATRTATSGGPLFWSRFENGTTLGPPHDCWSTGCWQSIVGTDASTGYTWPPHVWGATSSKFQLLADNPTGTMDPTAIGSYMLNRILPLTGHKGTLTNTLYSQVLRSGCCGQDPQGGGATQDAFLLQPTNETGDLYISYWIRYQPGLGKQLTPGTWRDLFKWKTGTPGQDDGDYRVLVQVATWNCPGSPTPPYCWLIQADNNASSSPAPLPAPGYYWQVTNSAVPVPIGHWFKFEVFWHRSTGADGRIWMAVNGHVICDRYGANKIAKNINRIFITNNYAGVAYPSSQWLDELQIWNGFPVVGAAEPWYDPPYSAH